MSDRPPFDPDDPSGATPRGAKTDVPEPLRAALDAARATPDRPTAWDALEDVARALQRPDEVDALYREMLSSSPIARRAVRFHDEWFDDRAALVALLARVLEADPTADWAFQRLALTYTDAARWSDLLALYDTALARTTDPAQRRAMLEEAVNVARDFAGDDARAIRYLDESFRLDPRDVRVATALERLFVDANRPGDLIALWRTRADVVAPDAKRALRVRIATCLLDAIDDAAAARAEIDALLNEEGPETPELLALLERVGTRPRATASVRRGALEDLRARFLAKKQDDDLERVLRALLDCTDGDDRAAVHREIADRLLARGRTYEAVRQWAAIVALRPADVDARGKLRELSVRTGDHTSHADALVAAAAAAEPALRAELLGDAGAVYADALRDPASAVKTFLAALAVDGIEPAAALAVSRRLLPLLDASTHARERLEVLERIGALATRDDEVRDALAAAAQQSELLGDVDRALAAWNRRLERDATDGAARAAIIELLTRAERWDALIEALRKRSDLPTRESVRPRAKKARKKTERVDTPTASRREGLSRIARVFADALNDAPAAEREWLAIEREFGVDDEIDDATHALLMRQQRHADAALRAERALVRAGLPARRAELFTRMGDIHRLHLASPDTAAAHYRDALAIDAAHAPARSGLRALVDAGLRIAPAITALADAYRTIGDASALLEITDARLDAAAGDAARAEILVEAARILEPNDPRAAMRHLSRALVATPADTAIDRDLVRLGSATSTWATVAAAYGDALVHVPPADDLAVTLRSRLAATLEDGLADPAAALGVYREILSARPEHEPTAIAIARTAAKLARWDDVASDALVHARAHGRLPDALADVITDAAERANAWDAVTAAWERILGPSDGDPGVASRVATTVAIWHRKHRDDLEASERVLASAAAWDPRNADALGLLAELQRRAPGVPLVETLLRLADAVDDPLGALYEAALVAVDQLADLARARPILERYVALAFARWRSPSEAAPLPHERDVLWAVDRMVRVLAAQDAFDGAARLLLDAAALPFDAERRRILRLRAAEIVARDVRDDAWAIELYAALVDEDPSDESLVELLAALHERTGQLEALLALRSRLLALTQRLDRRLELRLEIVRVLGMAGRRNERLKPLLDNLDERPGHADTLHMLSGVLEDEERASDLADIVVRQATLLETRGEPAAAWWREAARIFEVRLGDVDAALSAHRKVVTERADLPSLDALARLHGARGERASEAEWLERLLPLATPPWNADVSVRLASAHAAAGRADLATARLEAILADVPALHEARRMLATLYRDAGRFEALVAVQVAGADLADSRASEVALLRDAATVLVERLGRPSDAVPLLERACERAPDDAPLALARADALRLAGQLDVAKVVLDSLALAYGRRRPPERAAVHFQLARIAREHGDVAATVAQLELAASMDMVHVGVLRMLGEVAHDAGQLDRAERAYRMLLLVVRRFDPNRDDGTSTDSIGPAEVLYALHRIAESQGETRRAREALESAFEFAQGSAAESRRLERALRVHGAHAMLVRALRARAANTAEPARRADVLWELAEVLAHVPDAQNAESEARLQSLAVEAGTFARHARFVERATDATLRAQYRDALGARLVDARASNDAARARDLLLRLGDLDERDGDARSALGLYREALALAPPDAPLLLALERVGDRETRLAALRDFTDGALSVGSAERVAALYRRAAVELDARETASDGVETLLRALAADARHPGTRALLQRAHDAVPSDPRLALACERVARAAGDDPLLFEALDQRSGFDDTTPDLVREAVDLAVRLGRDDRVEPLLLRAIEIAAGGSGGIPGAAWALVALASRKRAAGDLEGARHWLRRAAEIETGDGPAQHAIDVAALAAGPINDLQLAAELYERLRRRDPTARTIWEPLLDVYRRMGDSERLEIAIKSVADSVLDSGERNALRLERARVLLERPERADEAIAALRYVLGDDPTHREATTLLESVLVRTGRADELASFFRQQLDDAWSRLDAPAIAALTLALGPLVEPTQRDAAREMYRTASEVVPGDVVVLDRLLALYDPDDRSPTRANVLERRLTLEQGENAADLALQLASLRDGHGDAAGTIRALERGLHAVPGHAALTKRLEDLYAEHGHHAALAALLERDAAAHTEPRAAAMRLREAAAVVLDQLRDAPRATEILRRARTLVPLDADVLVELVRAFHDAGAFDAGVAELDAVLAKPPKNPRAHAELLKLRGRLLTSMGRRADAVGDLQKAYALAPEALATDFAAALDAQREHANDDDRVALGRRLATVLAAHGDVDRARDVVAEILERLPSDREALRLACDIEMSAAHWSEVAAVARRWVDVEQGVGKVDPALRLADASDALGEPERARDVLEAVLREVPSNEAIRNRLATLYERAGAHGPMAALLAEGALHTTDEAAACRSLVRAGELYLRAVGDATQALRPLARAHDLRPGDVDAGGLYADALVALGRSDEAISVLESVIESSKLRRSRDLALIQQRLARIAASTGDRKAALGHLTRAMDNDIQNGALAAELAEMAMELGENDVALRALRAISLMKNPAPMGRAAAFLRQGVVALRLGDRKKAAFFARKAASEDAALTEAVDFLKELGE